MADWAGKLVGNVLRISGLLCRASVYQSHDFLMVQDALSVTGKTMSDAIRLGKYYLNHAQAAYSVLPENDMYENGNLILQKSGSGVSPPLTGGKLCACAGGLRPWTASSRFSTSLRITGTSCKTAEILRHGQATTAQICHQPLVEGALTGFCPFVLRLS